MAENIQFLTILEEEWRLNTGRPNSRTFSDVAAIPIEYFDIPPGQSNYNEIISAIY